MLKYIIFKTILILFYHLLLHLPSGFFPLEFSTKLFYALLISCHACCIFCQLLRFYHSNDFCQSIYVMKLVLVQMSPLASYFLSLKFRYSFSILFLLLISSNYVLLLILEIEFYSHREVRVQLRFFLYSNLRVLDKAQEDRL